MDREPHTGVAAIAFSLVAGVAVGMTERLGTQPSGGTLSIYVIDVGQGDSTLIMGPEDNGERVSILIDAGDNRRGIHGAEIVQGVLDDIGVTALDHVIVSHYEADHMGGFVTIGVGRQSLL